MTGAFYKWRHNDDLLSFGYSSPWRALHKKFDKCLEVLKKDWRISFVSMYWIYKLVIMDSLEYIEFYSANFSDFSFPWYNNLVQMVQDRWTTEYIHDLKKSSDKQQVFFVEN